VRCGNVLEFVADRHQQFHDLLGLARFVALIIRPEDLLRQRIDHDGLDGRRADVDADDDSIAGES
jgi:hypothetical protein